MYLADAEHAEIGLDLIRRGLYRQALRHLEDQDTAARDEIPEVVWRFLDKKVTAREVLQKVAKAPYEFNSEDFSERKVLEELEEHGMVLFSYNYKGYLITDKGKEELTKPI